jgi:PAS domain S-box-containing protein
MFFSVPDKEAQSQSYMVYMLTLIWSSTIAIIVSAGFYFFPEIWQRWTAFLGISLSIAFVNLQINRLGNPRLAAWTLTTMIWLFITIPCYSAGGMAAPGIISQMAVILTVGFLLGWRGGLLIGVLTMVADLGLVYLEMSGNLPEPSVVHTPLTRWIGAAIPFATIIALQYYSTNHLQDGLNALRREVERREAAVLEKDLSLKNLGERVKELRTLYAVSQILQDGHLLLAEIFQKIAGQIPSGFQFPDMTAARVYQGDRNFVSERYHPSKHCIKQETSTAQGIVVGVEVVFLGQNKGMSPFLEEEYSLMTMLMEMVKTDLERRERKVELEDFKYALDLAAMLSISKADGTFQFVNENFCKASQYSQAELVGSPHEILWSGEHSPEELEEVSMELQSGKPIRREFCNRAKDDSLYWVDATVVPFLDQEGKVYQYLSINYDITAQKTATEKIRESEELIKRITSQVPGNSYMFEIEESGGTSILFMNRGTEPYNYSFGMEVAEESPEKLRELIHEEDRDIFNQAMKEAYLNPKLISLQYRVVFDGILRWRWLQAVPEKNKEGKIIWYGASSDITPLVEYIVSIEQMIFDVGHVIRRPLSTMLGLTSLIQEKELEVQEIKSISKHLFQISGEMDKFIRELNEAYHQKRQDTQLKIDTSRLINTRDSLFS